MCGGLRGAMGTVALWPAFNSTLNDGFALM